MVSKQQPIKNLKPSHGVATIGICLPQIWCTLVLPTLTISPDKTAPPLGKLGRENVFIHPSDCIEVWCDGAL